jgi:hypothetical protein
MSPRPLTPRRWITDTARAFYDAFVDFFLIRLPAIREPPIKFHFASGILSGAKEAAEKGLDLILVRIGVLQGLKPTLILRHLRHD